MRVLFTHQFLKQVRNVKDKRLAKRIESAISEIKNASSLSEINNLKELKGYNNAHRIRVGDYRIGIYFIKNTVEFSCFMHRKEIYRYFP